MQIGAWARMSTDAACARMAVNRCLLAALPHVPMLDTAQRAFIASVIESRVVAKRENASEIRTAGDETSKRKPRC